MSTSSPIFLPLEDEHVVRLEGLSSEDIKSSAKKLIVAQDKPCPKHTVILRFIGNALGFSDPASYEKKHWPDLQAFMRREGIQVSNRVDFFAADSWLKTDFFLHLSKKDVADRFFSDISNCLPLPKRIFVGHEVDCPDLGTSERGLFNVVETDPLAFHSPDPAQIAALSAEVEKAIDALSTVTPSTADAFTIAYRYRYSTQAFMNILGDTVLDPVRMPPLNQLYARDSFDSAPYNAGIWIGAARIFCKAIQTTRKGWLRVIRHSDNLIFLVDDAGRYDFLVRRMRTQEPARLRPVHVDLGDWPQAVADYAHFSRWYYFWPKAFELSDRHSAEAHHYAKGGKSGIGYPGADAILRDWLISQGKYEQPVNRRAEQTSGCTSVTAYGRKLFCSPLITRGQFDLFVQHSGWDLRREVLLGAIAKDFHEPLDLPTPNGSGPDYPIVCNWYDAIAYASWRSRQDGIAFRLPTRCELADVFGCYEPPESIQSNAKLISVMKESIFRPKRTDELEEESVLAPHTASLRIDLGFPPGSVMKSYHEMSFGLRELKDLPWVVCGSGVTAIRASDFFEWVIPEDPALMCREDEIILRPWKFPDCEVRASWGARKRRLIGFRLCHE